MHETLEMDYVFSNKWPAPQKGLIDCGLPGIHMLQSLEIRPLEHGNFRCTTVREVVICTIRQSFLNGYGENYPK